MLNFHLYSISRIRNFLTTDICHQVSLQSDINAIGQWSESNGMKLNITKTKVMHMTRSKKSLNLPRYTLQGSELAVTSAYKYLGVTINNTLTWSDHVDAVAKKANKT